MVLKVILNELLKISLTHRWWELFLSAIFPIYLVDFRHQVFLLIRYGMFEKISKTITLSTSIFRGPRDVCITSKEAAASTRLGTTEID